MGSHGQEVHAPSPTAADPGCAYQGGWLWCVELPEATLADASCPRLPPTEGRPHGKSGMIWGWEKGDQHWAV